MKFRFPDFFPYIFITHAKGNKSNKSIKMEEKRFLDVQELTDYIHMSESYVYKKVSQNQIPILSWEPEPCLREIKSTVG